MTKAEMIKNVASEADVTNKVAEAVLDAYGKFVFGVLAENKDEKIPLPGLGTFKVKEVGERHGKIMLGDRKGEEYISPAHFEIKFQIAKNVKVL